MECRSKGQGLHIEALGRHRTEIKALSKARKTHANNQKGNLMTAKRNFSSFIITPQQRSPLRIYLSWKQMQKSWSFPQGLWLPLFSWKIFNHSVNFTLFFFFSFAFWPNLQSLRSFCPVSLHLSGRFLTSRGRQLRGRGRDVSGNSHCWSSSFNMPEVSHCCL